MTAQVEYDLKQAGRRRRAMVSLRSLQAGDQARKQMLQIQEVTSTNAQASYVTIRGTNTALDQADQRNAKWSRRSSRVLAICLIVLSGFILMVVGVGICRWSRKRTKETDSISVTQKETAKDYTDKPVAHSSSTPKSRLQEIISARSPSSEHRKVNPETDPTGNDFNTPSTTHREINEEAASTLMVHTTPLNNTRYVRESSPLPQSGNLPEPQRADSFVDDSPSLSLRSASAVNRTPTSRDVGTPNQTFRPLSKAQPDSIPTAARISVAFHLSPRGVEDSDRFFANVNGRRDLAEDVKVAPAAVQSIPGRESLILEANETLEEAE
eukprot:gb/GEZN01010349.1/.p1 GENE.gb/GEZN01010349.1/~~gb/GEZN01010349.1/.p1  ORF type:complete len:380 (-),score=35.76 gb/GEZN01010349.1/:109-1083(-)